MAMHYLVTALWSTKDYDGKNLDDSYAVTDISEEFKAQAQKDCDNFYAKAQNLFTERELDFEQIGHDFWLTRHHHGAGFWDGDYKNGEALTKLAQQFSEVEDQLRESVTKDENETL